MYEYNIGNPGTYPAKNIIINVGKWKEKLNAFGIGYANGFFFANCANPLYARKSSELTPSGYKTMKSVYLHHVTTFGTSPKSLKK